MSISFIGAVLTHKIGVSVSLFINETGEIKAKRWFIQSQLYMSLFSKWKCFPANEIVRVSNTMVTENVSCILLYLAEISL